MNVRWSPVQGAVQYVVRIRKVGEPVRQSVTAATQLVLPEGTGFLDPGIYQVFVRSCLATCGPDSAPVSVVVPGAAPVAVTTTVVPTTVVPTTVVSATTVVPTTVVPTTTLG